MTLTNTIIVFTLIIVTLTAISQQPNSRKFLGRSHATHEIQSTLLGNTQHNVINNKTIIINDSTTAINVAEPILFGIYGTNNITRQRPYETYFIDNYWIIGGTLPEKSCGGTFLIIIDARTNQIVKLTHGK